jgi:cell fate regulator YaaT (PSP1 superfamily)
MPELVSVRFKRACKIYDFDCNGQKLTVGDTVIVGTERGIALGKIVYRPVDTRIGTLSKPLKKVIRKAEEMDFERLEFNEERERGAFKICKEKIESYNLPMRLINVEYLFDSSKAIFYFISEKRVDFRELVKDLATEFHTRIEMKQVGVRDETKLLGGIGPCGRELCCSSFLRDFEPITVRMAKEQNVALNPAKISGLCGRLMCCLIYEHDTTQDKADITPSVECNGCDSANGTDVGVEG